MKPENILEANVLDIIFENRNKEYGAYALRRDYNRRLKTGISVMLGVVILFALFNLGWNGKKTIVDSRTFEIIDPRIAELLPDPKQPPTPKKVPAASI
ncbi:MAG: energy transducer TonB, partial [Chitinophagaceae bacterium]|nr:energy transducer TonB [Chitinophagaceae bacterium]